MENPIYKYRKLNKLSLRKLSEIISNNLVDNVSPDGIKTAEGFYNFESGKALNIINSLDVLFDNVDKKAMYNKYYKWKELRDITLNTEFIFFGSDKVDKVKFNKATNSSCSLNKPDGGIWLSPKSSNKDYISDWEQWCLECGCLDFLSDKYISVKLKEDTRIYVINGYDCLKDMIEIYGVNDEHYMPETFVIPNFENVAKRYDGIFLTEKGYNETHLPMGKDFKFNLYGWDCSSLVLFNIDCIDSYKSFKYEKRRQYK